MSQYVAALDRPLELETDEAIALLGGKGASLCDAVALGLPVPHGFVLTTAAADAFAADGWTDELDASLVAAMAELEQRTGRALGGSPDPLLLSVRMSPVVECDGLMPAAIGVGTLTTAVGADELSAAVDTRLRAIRSMATSMVGGAHSAGDDPFDRHVRAAMTLADVASPSLLPAPLLAHLVDRHLDVYAELTGAAFPESPLDQLRAVVRAALASWSSDRAVASRNRSQLAHQPAAAVVVQVAVLGSSDDGGTGIAWSRSPRTGEAGLHVRFASNEQGNRVLDATHAVEDRTAVADRHPDAIARLETIARDVEVQLGDMAEIEFTIERGELHVLRIRTDTSRSGAAAFRVAHDLTSDDAIGLTHEQALLRVTADHVEQVLHPSFDTSDRVALAIGLPASPGAAVGKVVLSADAATTASSAGEAVILVREETSPEDVHGMAAAVGIVTSRGGLASHAAVVARGWGTPAVCGAEAIELHADHFTVDGQRISEGDVISIDGSTGEILQGALDVTSVEPPPEFEAMLAWADDIRSDHLAIRANADTGGDAGVARSFGAEGIGLCRTEHMFLGEDRLPIMRQMILAATPAKEKMALSRLRMAQRDDFLEILEAMDGLPVTVRLLDPPLHEFLPDVEHLVAKQAAEGLDDEEQELLRAARAWQEQNPMIGTRGVRLGYLKPGLYTMQVTALMEAVAERKAMGGSPVVEVMIPLTVTAEELAGARRWVTDVLETEAVDGAEVSIGTMIETPRAALRAAELAHHADFFSFGTNDLTQLTYGFSRDDVEGRIMALYLDQGLLDGNPFESIDRDGVGELVELGASRGRATAPGLKLGVCGEHGGDPASISLFLAAGLDYVSCSPYRVPVARIAVAQAVIEQRAQPANTAASGRVAGSMTG